MKEPLKVKNLIIYETAKNGICSRKDFVDAYRKQYQDRKTRTIDERIQDLKEKHIIKREGMVYVFDNYNALLRFIGDEFSEKDIKKLLFDKLRREAKEKINNLLSFRKNIFNTLVNQLKNYITINDEICELIIKNITFEGVRFIIRNIYKDNFLNFCVDKKEEKNIGLLMQEFILLNIRQKYSEKQNVK